MNLNLFTTLDSLNLPDVTKLVLRGDEGYFSILPRHIDYVTALVPGLLKIEQGSQTTYFLLDQGVLVKKGDQVSLAVRQFVRTDGPGTLNKAVLEQFEKIDEQEKKSRGVIHNLEVEIYKHFLELK